MCGRFTLTRSAAEVAAHFDLEAAPELAPRWNAAPGQDVAVVRATRPGGAGRVLEARHWGWPVGAPAAGPGAASREAVNARAETAGARPAFREALRRRRALVPADGFYEWRGARGRRAPWHAALPGGGLFGLAALVGDGDPAGSPPRVVVLTTEARGPMRALHDRMPVLVPPAAYASWLDPADEGGAAALGAVLEGELAETLVLRPVSRRVNDVAHDDPACLAPPEDPELPLGGGPAGLC